MSLVCKSRKVTVETFKFKMAVFFSSFSFFSSTYNSFWKY